MAKKLVRVGSKLLSFCSSAFVVIYNYFSESLLVIDPPDILDTNLVNVAELLSVHLKTDEFYRFGVNLLIDSEDDPDGELSKTIHVKLIEENDKENIKNKCLGLLKLWINRVDNPQWEQLIKASRKSKVLALARKLTDEFECVEPQNRHDPKCEELKQGKSV